MNNPLLDFSDLPRFDQIRPEHVAPAMDDLLASAESALATVTAPDFPAKWTSIATVLDVATERLGRAWGAVAHLNSVADTPELRAAFNAVLPKITEFWTRLGADERLFAKYKAIDPKRLNAEQRQAHRNTLRNFVLGGAELTGAARERFAQIQERQAELAQKFSENALDATDAFEYIASEAELDGVPDDVKQTALAAAAAQDKAGYKLTLKMPCYLPVMQFARSSALRHVLYRAYVTRASDQAEGDAARFDNSALIRDILALRQEEARLLGFVNFGEVSVVPKMAESPQEVITFLRDLSKKARPYAEKAESDAPDRDPQRQQPEPGHGRGQAHQDRGQRKAGQAGHRHAIRGKAVGQLAGLQQHQGQHRAAGQQHQPRLVAGKAQADLGEHRRQVGRAVDADAIGQRHQHGGAKARFAEDAEIQQRMQRVAFPQHEARGQRQTEANCRRARRRLADQRGQAAEQRTQRGDYQHQPDPVEGPLVRPCQRPRRDHVARRQRDRRQAQRHRNEEHRGPAEMVDQKTAGHWPDGR